MADKWDQFSASPNSPAGDKWSQFAQPGSDVMITPPTLPIGPVQPPPKGYLEELWQQSGLPGLFQGLQEHPLSTLGQVAYHATKLLPTSSDFNQTYDTVQRGPKATAAAATLATLPLLAGAATKVPWGEVGENAAKTARGASAGFAEGMVNAKTTPLGLAGFGIGEHFGHPVLGTILGAGPQIARDMWTGIRREFAAPPPAEYVPMEGFTPGSVTKRNMPKFGGIATSDQPVGRNIPRAKPDLSAPPEATYTPQEPFKPSSRTKNLIKFGGPTREIQPIGKTIPRRGLFSQSAEEAPAAAPAVAPQPVAPPPVAAAAAAPSNMGLSTAPLSKVEQAAMPPQASWSDANRMLHSTIQELELPGSPAGKRAPGVVSKLAQDMFKAKSARDLTPSQLDLLNDFIVTNKRLPKIGEIK